MINDSLSKVGESIAKNILATSSELKKIIAENGGLKKVIPYNYTTPAGIVQWSKIKFIFANGEKTYRSGYIDANGDTRQKLSDFGDKRIRLYNLHSLETADKNNTLYIVEGEKCADVLTNNGYLATSSDTGASSLIIDDVSLNIIKKYKNVIFIPDNDSAGKQAIPLWISYIPTIRIVETKDIWPNLNKLNDVADYAEYGADMSAIGKYQLPMAYDDSDIDFSRCNFEDITSPVALYSLYYCTDEFVKATISAKINRRAKELGCLREYRHIQSAYQANQEKLAELAKEAKAKRDEKREPFASKTSVATANIDFLNGLSVPKGFSISENSGIEFEGSTILDVPIFPAEFHYDKSGTLASILLKYLENDKWKKYIIKQEDLKSKRGILSIPVATLTERNAEDVRDFFTAFITCNRDKIKKVTLVEKLGWNGNTFQFPDETTSLNDFEELGSYICTSGSFEVWKKAAKKILFNFPAAAFILFAAFAGTLVKILNVNNFAILLYGKAGSGKSTILKFAVSAWGAKELLGSLNASSRAFVKRCMFLQDFTTIYDDAEIDSEGRRDYNKCLNSISELVGGHEKDTLTKERVFVQGRTWNGGFIYSAEHQSTSYSSKNGKQRRLLQICCDNTFISDINDMNGIDYCSELTKTAAQNYGFAARAFINNLIEQNLDINWIYQIVKEIVMNIADVKNKLIDHVNTVVLICTAGFILEAFILEIDDEEAKADIKRIASYIIKSINDAEETNYIENGINSLYNSISEHLPNFIHVSKKNNSSKTDAGNNLEYASMRNNYADIHGYIEDGYYFVNANIGKEYLHKQGFNDQTIFREMKRQKLLITNTSSPGFTVQRTFNGSRCSYYQILPYENKEDK